MKKMLYIIVIIAAAILLSACIILNQPKFGQAPRGERLERVKKSANYADDAFKNLSETPVMTSKKGSFGTMLDVMFAKKVRLTPKDNLPIVRTDLKALNGKDDVLVWFGHSSYFIRLDGKTFLVDPVFSNFASPFSFINKAFKGTSVFQPEDLPEIDYLIITHDHWDHLDYTTVLKLKPKVQQIVCSLGVGQNFEYWGFDPKKITDLDWYESINLGEGWQITATPARHFSGRGLKRNQTLWASFVLQAPDFKMFLGGDSGYDTHFSKIGETYGPFDLAIMEQGQYSKNWSAIHMLPEQLFQAAADLKARKILPVHNSKFALAQHQWDEPLNKIAENASNSNIAVITPQIGEVFFLKDSTQIFTQWWKNID